MQLAFESSRHSLEALPHTPGVAYGRPGLSHQNQKGRGLGQSGCREPGPLTPSPSLPSEVCFQSG